MGAVQRDETPGLAVEVAKLRLRVAAEKAEPARLLRHQVGEAPLGSAMAAVAAGLALGRTARGKARAAGTGGAAGTGTAGGTGPAGPGFASGAARAAGSSAAAVLGPVLTSLLSSLVAGAASEWRKR